MTRRSDRVLSGSTVERMMCASFEFGERICVVGMGGKTSFSRALGTSRGLDVIHLDEIAWLPEWTVRDKAEQLEMMSDAISSSGGGWVVDGNLSQVEAELILAQADTVVWLHLPHFATWWNITWRSVQRAWNRKRVCGENYETFRHILGRESMIWWSLFNWRASHRKIERIVRGSFHRARVIELRSYGDLNAAYDAIGADPVAYRAP